MEATEVINGLTNSAGSLQNGISGISAATKDNASKADIAAGVTAGVSAIATTASNIGSDKLIKNHHEIGGNALKYGASGLQAGMTAGGLAGPLGSAIVGGGGLAVGTFAGVMAGVNQKKARIKGEKEIAELIAKRKSDLNDQMALNTKRAQEISSSENLILNQNVGVARNGGKLIFKFKRGGSIDLIKENVILDGPSHETHNKTGVKNDKGLPIVKKGVKVAEIESLELVLNNNSSKEIEKLVEEYKKTKDKKILEKLGTLMKKEVNHNTYDYSKELL